MLELVFIGSPPTSTGFCRQFFSVPFATSHLGGESALRSPVPTSSNLNKHGSQFLLQHQALQASHPFPLSPSGLKVLTHTPSTPQGTQGRTAELQALLRGEQTERAKPFSWTVVLQLMQPNMPSAFPGVRTHRCFTPIHCSLRPQLCFCKDP